MGRVIKHYSQNKYQMVIIENKDTYTVQVSHDSKLFIDTDFTYLYNAMDLYIEHKVNALRNVSPQ